MFVIFRFGFFFLIAILVDVRCCLFNLHFLNDWRAGYENKPAPGMLSAVMKLYSAKDKDNYKSVQKKKQIHLSSTWVDNAK